MTGRHDRIGQHRFGAPASCWRLVIEDLFGWESVNWNSVNWNSVNWNSVNWNSVNWNSVNWNSVNWNSVNWNSATVVEMDDYYAAVSNRSTSAADFVWTTPAWPSAPLLDNQLYLPVIARE